MIFGGTITAWYQTVLILLDRQEQDYGTVAVFEDLYGNNWDLLQLSEDHPMSIRTK